eukprot:Rhum_TRINITY_DN1103_c0_g1::Rhum_TRINITY_DN1103_c0_g1_i1::g.3320::m.3320
MAKSRRESGERARERRRNRLLGWATKKSLQASAVRRGVAIEGEEQLAVVLRGVEVLQGGGDVVEAAADVVLLLDLPALVEAQQLHHGTGVLLQVVEDEEALHPRAGTDQRQIRARPLHVRGRLRVVLADAATEHDARPRPQALQRRLQRLAADVVEEDVQPLGAVPPQLLRDAAALLLVVDGRVEAQLLNQVPALLGAARDADDAARPPHAGQLSRHAPGRARRTRDHDHIAALHLADLVNAEEGRQPGGAQQALRELERRARRQRRQLVQVRRRRGVARVEDEAVAPPHQPREQVARRVLRRPGLDDAGEAAGLHHVARRDLLHVASLRQPRALRRVEAQPQRAAHDVAVPQRRQRRLVLREVLRADQTHDLLLQAPLLCDWLRHFIFLVPSFFVLGLSSASRTFYLPPAMKYRYCSFY